MKINWHPQMNQKR